MSEPDRFSEAEVVKRANVYYDGQVTSREVWTADGVRKTLGIMQPGEYAFETDAKEEIELYAGRLSVTVDGTTTRYESGDEFTVPEGSEFTAHVTELVDYCCTYR